MIYEWIYPVEGSAAQLISSMGRIKRAGTIGNVRVYYHTNLLHLLFVPYVLCIQCTVCIFLYAECTEYCIPKCNAFDFDKKKKKKLLNI